MSDVQIAVIDQQDTQIVLAVPGVQGATGSSIPSGGTVDQVLRKNSSTDYDAGWTQVTSAMIANGTIVNEDVNNSAAIAGTKISPDFGGQAISTTAQVNAARVNVTANTAPTNGIYLPASNTVGISTNGTGKLFVDASGNVGVGAIPTSKLTVRDEGGTDEAAIRIEAYRPALRFIDINASTTDAEIRADSGNITFNNGLESDPATLLTERLRITSTGELKHIGGGSVGDPAVYFAGSAPAKSLYVQATTGYVGLGTSEPTYLLELGSASYSGANQFIARNDASNDLRLGIAAATKTTRWLGCDVSDDNFFIGRDSSVSDLVIDSSGNVGVGTSSPGTAATGTFSGLHIEGTATNGDLTTLLLRNPDTTADTAAKVSIEMKASSSSRRGAKITAFKEGTYADATQADIGLQLSTVVNDAYVDAVTIKQDGKVGVGTTAPTGDLHVKGSTLVLEPSSVAVAHRLGFSTADLLIEADVGNGAASNIVFKNDASERARIDSSGRLLVGTPASPAYQLQLDTDSAGKPSTNTWTIVSDERIKEEIELADLDLCYEAVKNIPLKRFKWKDEVYTEDQAYDRRKLGWIAQDVEAVFPKAVRQHEFKYNQVFEEVIVPAVPAELDEDGNVITEEQPERIEKGELISEEVIEDCRDLNSDQLYAAMYGAIQKLISKVETLEAEIAALKA